MQFVMILQLKNGKVVGIFLVTMSGKDGKNNVQKSFWGKVEGLKVATKKKQGGG